jgi:hypothetical protein
VEVGELDGQERKYNTLTLIDNQIKKVQTGSKMGHQDVPVEPVVILDIIKK